jgi:hypothetical protein
VNALGTFIIFAALVAVIETMDRQRRRRRRAQKLEAIKRLLKEGYYHRQGWVPENIKVRFESWN